MRHTTGALSLPSFQVAPTRASEETTLTPDASPPPTPEDSPRPRRSTRLNIQQPHPILPNSSRGVSSMVPGSWLYSVDQHGLTIGPVLHVPQVTPNELSFRTVR